VEITALDESDELLQSGFWGHFKQRHGWRALSLEATVCGPPDTPPAEGIPPARGIPPTQGAPTAQDPCRFLLLVLTRRLFRLWTLAYVPFGPVRDPGTARGDFLLSLAAAIRPHLPRNTFLLRYDLPWEKRGEAPDAGAVRRVRKAASDIQPPSTVLVDLTPPEERILASMKPKTRYNIRLAERKGVTVARGAPADIDEWYRIYRETSLRDGIAIHEKAYYADLLSACGYGGRSPAVSLLLAHHGGELLAGNVVIFWRGTAVYLTGASASARRNLMPTYALQWSAMREARGAGCAVYDLYGIPARPDPGHPMFGLYQFKTGFSDRIVERWGTWDVPCRRPAFLLYSLAEAARMAFFRGLRKRGARRRRTAGRAEPAGEQA
jgi:lipid II:glycine glycyltransferase (peptidoglycan interpeptide bridge formation enzyme)